MAWGSGFPSSRTIADEIATALAPRLGAGRGSRGAATREQPAAARPAPVNAEAYQDYLRGRHFFHKWTPEGFGKAVEFFQKAIETDPAYAPAYAGLADAYGAAAFYGFIPPQEAMPRVEFAASRALALDSRLAEAHASLGLCDDVPPVGRQPPKGSSPARSSSTPGWRPPASATRSS